MYGFNLGQIEGLDSSVKTVTLTIANASESNTYTLTYDEINFFWIDYPYKLQKISPQSDNYELIDESNSLNVGDVYNITLSTESIEPNFKAAVEEVANAVYETPTDVENAIMSSLPALFATAIQTGKSNATVTLPTDVETAFQIKKIAEDVVSGKNVTIKMSTSGYAIKPIVGGANNNMFEYTLLFYYNYNNSYIFRVTIGFSFNHTSLSNKANMFAELMASP